MANNRATKSGFAAEAQRKVSEDKYYVESRGTYPGFFYGGGGTSLILRIKR